MNFKDILREIYYIICPWKRVRGEVYEGYKTRVKSTIKKYGFFNPTPEGIAELATIEKEVREDTNLDIDEIICLLEEIAWPGWYPVEK